MTRNHMFLKECPACHKNIPSGIVLCPYCKKDEKGQNVAAETSAAGIDPQFQTDLNGLSSDDPMIRQNASDQIAQRGIAVVPVLVQVLMEHSVRGLPEVAKLLGRLRDTRAIPALIQAGKIGDEDLRVAAVSALTAFREPEVLEELLAEANRPNPAVQGYIAHTLGNFQDSRALPILSKLAKHKSEEVAFQAVSAIGDLGDPSGIRVLRQMLSRKEPIVRDAAAGALRRLGGPVRRVVPVAYYLSGCLAGIAGWVIYFCWLHYK